MEKGLREPLALAGPRRQQLSFQTHTLLFCGAGAASQDLTGGKPRITPGQNKKEGMWLEEPVPGPTAFRGMLALPYTSPPHPSPNALGLRTTGEGLCS